MVARKEPNIPCCVCGLMLKRSPSTIARNKRNACKEHRAEAISQSNFGKKHTTESKAKMSAWQIGRKRGAYSAERRANISKALMGVKPNWKPGAKELWIEKHKQFKPTPEMREKIRAARARQVFPVKDSSIEVKTRQMLTAIGELYEQHKFISIKDAYTCDFYLPKRNTIIECDGKYWHNYPHGKSVDHRRTEQMRKAGFKVLRLWEQEIRVMTPDQLLWRLYEAA